VPGEQAAQEYRIGFHAVDAFDHVTCIDCGRRVRRDGSGGFVHAGFGAVAACDLDADHPAVPDLREAGIWACRHCGEPAIANSLNVCRHVAGDHDADHPAQA
jgi:hypothetical protein